MDQTTTQVRTEADAQQKKNYARPKRMEWLHKTNCQLRLLRCCMVVLCGMLTVIGALLLILPAFKVKKIEVIGDLVTTTEEEIIEASGIAYGTEIIGTDWKVAAKNIEKQCPVHVTLTVTLNKVKIHVTDLGKTQMKYGDYWVALDADFNVVDIRESEEGYDGLLQLKLPKIVGINQGEALCFSDGAVDLNYVRTVVDFLESEDMVSRVGLLDVSEKFNVSCVLDESYRVVLGKVGDLDEKMEIADEIISMKNGADAYALIDVSDVKRSTYRPMDVSTFLYAG